VSVCPGKKIDNCYIEPETEFNQEIERNIRSSDNFIITRDEDVHGLFSFQNKSRVKTEN
jgi:hypothetical protein